VGIIMNRQEFFRELYEIYYEMDLLAQKCKKTKTDALMMHFVSFFEYFKSFLAIHSIDKVFNDLNKF
jgi:hypothetical protein